jgi:hypothetical protein
MGGWLTSEIWGPHLRDGYIVAKILSRFASFSFLLGVSDPNICTGTGRVGASDLATSTATNGAASASRKRFFHSYNCQSRRPRSRQNVATLLPLSTCSDTRPRHRAQSSSLCCLIAQECPPIYMTTRCCSHSAHLTSSKNYLSFNGSEEDGLGSASETRAVWSRRDGVALGSDVLFVMGT